MKERQRPASIPAIFQIRFRKLRSNAHEMRRKAVSIRGSHERRLWNVMLYYRWIFSAVMEVVGRLLGYRGNGQSEWSGFVPGDTWLVVSDVVKSFVVAWICGMNRVHVVWVGLAGVFRS
jgi:hypothetical protein